jgi:hypothetical protein
MRIARCRPRRTLAPWSYCPTSGRVARGSHSMTCESHEPVMSRLVVALYSTDLTGFSCAPTTVSWPVRKSHLPERRAQRARRREPTSAAERGSRSHGAAQRFLHDDFAVHSNAEGGLVVRRVAAVQHGALVRILRHQLVPLCLVQPQDLRGCPCAERQPRFAVHQSAFTLSHDDTRR